MNDLSVAVVMFEGAEEQDVVGPYKMFWWMTAFQGSLPNVFTVAPTSDTYGMSSGMRFFPDFSYDNAPAANVIVVPGGHGARDIPALQRNGTIDYIKKVASPPRCKYIMSVCTGNFVLGIAGLLDGRHCTTYSNQYGRFEKEVPKCKLIKDASLSFVQDGNLFTSNGPCSGLATSLRLVEVHCGTGYKNNLRELLSYRTPPVKGALIENGKITVITV